MAEKGFYDIKGLGELPDEQEASHPAAPYRPAQRAPKLRHTRRNVAIIVAVVLVLVAGSGAYWFAKHHTSAKAKAPVASNSLAPSAPSATASTSSTTTHYVSKGQDLNLEFDYPASWSVAPASGGNAGDQTITVSSPMVSIPDATDTATNGKVALTIRPGTASLSELGTGTPTAAQDSFQIAYAHPTASQHQYTYLTFIHLTGGANTTGAFEEVLVTGIQQFKKNDPVTTTVLTGIDPIIAANFYKCGASDCSGKGAGNLSITSATWQNNSFVQQIQTIFESLKLN